MREHRIYYGFLKNDHYFVEVRRNLFDEWNIQDVRNMTHRDIVKWNLKRRGNRYKKILMNKKYFEQGCGKTVKLLFTIKRTNGMKEKEYQELKFKRYNK